MISYAQEGFAVATDLFPLILLAMSFGLLILLLAVMVDTLSIQSRRLHQMTRHLRELSKVVRQQARPGEQLSDQDEDLALTTVSPGGEITEDDRNIVQPADGPVDLQEQLTTVRDVILTEAAKKNWSVGCERERDQGYAEERNRAA
jgi:hypothetical protein